MNTSRMTASLLPSAETPLHVVAQSGLAVVRPRILAVTMLDDASVTALRRATRWAELFQATLHVLHVQPWQVLPGVTRREAVEPPSPLDRYQSALVATQQWVAEVLGFALPDDQLHLVEGSLEDQIAAVANLIDASFIIMGEDHQKVNGVLRPRVATQLVRKNQRPVLIARSESLAHRVLAATDLTDPSYPALAYASSLSSLTGAKMSFLHHVEHASSAFMVGREFTARGSLQGCDLPTLATQLAEEHLERLTTLFGEQTETIVTHRGDVINTIIQVAESQAADLIIVGAHDESTTERWPTGGISYAVARRAPCSVLLVPLAAN